MGAGAVSGPKNSQNNNIHNTSDDHTTGESCNAEAGQASQKKPKSPKKNSPSSNMSCELCSVNFTFFKRKKYCVECQRYFCSTCLPKPPSSAPQGRKCSKCRLLLSGCFTRTDLQNYKVKDIRCFLKVKNISMAGCKEKHDLIELVFTHFCTQNGANSDESEHDMLVRQMAANMRNVSFVHEDRLENCPTNTSVPDQRSDSEGNQQAAPPTSSTALTLSPTATTASTTFVSSSASATATSGAPITSSSSTSTAAAVCASSSTTSSTSAENDASNSAAGGHSSHNLASETRAGRNESSAEPDGWEGLEEDLEERINNLNTDRLRELLQAMERLQQSFAASQEDDEQRPAAPTVRRTQLDDVKAVEDVENLTVRQLKELLVNNFVDYRGCCERSELVEKVKNLWRDHQENVAIAQEIQEEEQSEAAGLSTKKAGMGGAKHPSESSGFQVETENSNNSMSGAEKDSPNPQHSGSSNPADLSSQDTTDQEASATAKAGPPSSPEKLAAEASSTESSSPRRVRNQQDSLCNICMDNLADCILLECGHMVTCTQCGKRLANCPICRQYISRVVRVFRT